MTGGYLGVNEFLTFIRNAENGVRERGMFEARAVSALLEGHGAGRRDRSSQIWALVCFEEWARRWLDG